MSKSFSQKNIAKKQWIKHWAGQWKLLNNSYLGYQYTKLLKDDLGQGLEQAIFVSHRGYSVCYLTRDYYAKLGNFLVKKVITTQPQVNRWSKLLMKETDAILGLIKKFSQGKVTASQYHQFIKALYSYCTPHRVVKVSVDFFDQAKLKKFLPTLSKARVYAEPVFTETEKFMELVAGQIAKTTGYPKNHLLYITKEEMDQYWKTGHLPAKTILTQRYQSSAILYDRGRWQLVTGQQSDRLEQALETQKTQTGVIKGFTAYPGTATGKVKIIFDPKKSKNFQTGDILVTGMTRPEYLGLMKKAAAFITDAGGMLSHAAITARELKKPCVVGTLTASKQLKDGDLVEVNATTGIIKKLSIK